MRSLTKALCFVVPAGLLALALGCTPASTPAPADDTNPSPKAEMTELASTGWGTLKGKATLDGPPPADLDKQNSDLMALIEKNLNKDVCLMGSKAEKEQQAWRIGGDGAVQNVVVFLR